MTVPHPLLVALNRFGLGARGAAAVYLTGGGSDPRRFVLAELEAGKTDLGYADLRKTPELMQDLFIEQKNNQQRLKAAAMAPPPGPDVPKPPPLPNMALATYRQEALARFQQESRVACGVVERLVAFWSNHFAVSALKTQVTRVLVGAMEREAIRPHVLGRFSDMLKAVERHPAMLNFLENQLSAGPDSLVARRNPKRGLNENLAREIMELHTLGVNGGYSQADVTSLARIITGWTFAGPDGRLAPPGTFLFIPQWHEPGPQTVLGHTFDQPGVAQGEAALDMLARQPATAHFVATKLVRHFIADEPPPDLVAKLSAVFLKTEGDLGAVSHALVTSDEAWSLPLAKMRTPREFVTAVVRLLGRTPEEPNRLLGLLNQLGQPLWSPGGPNGFADDNGAWAAPEQMKLRLDLAFQVARQLRDPPDPRDLVDEVLGPAASPATRQAVARAESKQQGFALLVMSPELQRR